MKRTRFVTFPRSGHHWLISMLQERIPEMVYAEHHSTGVTLENDPEVNAQKTHDFQIDVHPSGEYQHVVQVRNKLDSMASWARIHGCAISEIPKYANVRADFRARWIEKWVIDPVPNRIIVHYEDLVSNTERELDRIVRHIT